MASFLSIPPPQSLLQRHRPSPSVPFSALIKPPRRAYICPSSSLQTPDPLIAQQEDSSPPSSPELAVPSTDNLQSRGCKTCGREEIEKGCNGEGRIQGGIATVPGFGWWPIKAFRPCPGFVESGGRYRRRGQSMDEVAFGRGGRDSSTGSTDTTRSSKRRQGSKKLEA